MKLFNSFISFSILIFISCSAYSQNNNQLIDKIVAVVGGKMVLQSDVSARLQEYVVEKLPDSNNRCKVLEDLMYEKLLLLEAEKDTTIIVSDAQVEQEFDKRMNFYLGQFGSKQEFEKYYQKTVDQFKEDLKPDIRDLLMAQQQRGKVIDNVTVSPEEVRRYYESLPKDSVPQINMQVVVAQITKMPEITDEEKAIAKQRIEDIRQDVINGKDMATEAIMYSEDPGSSHSGGYYKNIRRGQFDPEFEKVAYSLKDSEISKVFLFPYGYDFIQLIHRHGDLLDLRHILISPVVSDKDMGKCDEQLDSIYGLIKKDSITFSDAAAKFSDDKNTKFNGGIMINPQTGISKWDMNMLGQLDLSFVIYMNVGDIRPPEIFNSPDGKKGYRIVKLISMNKPHKANLQEDYQMIENAALSHKQQRIINDWISRKIKEGLYVHIDKDFTNCHFQNKWVNNL
jgi:peptidyl-prolyl cis-trans isomerase SurA